jgi:hypothetical protein
MSLETFLMGRWEPVSSSNVAEAAYDRDSGRLLVRYKSGGGGWWYEVGREAAEAFYAAPSHGGWLWDNVKVRGSRSEHQVPAGRL